MNRAKLEQDLKQRVADIVKSDYKSSVNKFAAELGLRQTTLNDQINGNGKISATTILSILQVRQDISAEWLLRGTGDKTNNRSSIESRITRLEQQINQLTNP